MNIKRREKEWKRPIPPTYKQFLRLHDGWDHFWLDFTIAGVAGPHTERMAGKVKEYIEWQEDDLRSDLEVMFPEKIREWEQARPRNLCLANHLSIATTFGGDLLVYDTRTARADGEMELVYWTLDFGAWEDRRFSDFHAMLQWALGEAQNTLGQLTCAKPAKRAAKKRPEKD